MTRRGRCVAVFAAGAGRQALASLDRLEATGAALVLTGHGPVWKHGVADACASEGRRSS